MATTRMTYAAKADITISLANLPNSGVRSSLVVDNSSNRYIDTFVGGRFIAPTGGSVNANGVTRLYAYGSSDDGIHYSDLSSGTDITHSLNGNAFFLGHVVMDASGESVAFGPYSVGAVFGGMLPEHWGVMVENATGRAFNNNAGHYSMWYQGIHFDTA